MDPQHLSFWARLWLAIWLPWKLLVDGVTAARVERAARVDALPEPPKELPAHNPEPALHLLAVLQREGRLLDFLEEEVTTFSDAEVGAASRVVHEGCRRALRQYLTLKPVRADAEGAVITVPEGFDPVEVRLTGRVAAKGPWRGRLAHPGWRAAEVKLPPLPEGQDAHVLAPAEVELS